MTEHDHAQAERIRRLMERRGGRPPAPTSGAPPTPSTPTAPDPESGSAATVREPSTPRRGTPPIAVRPNRRRHVAAAGRVLAAGASASAFLLIVAGLAAHPPAWASGTASGTAGAPEATTAVPTTVVPPPTVPPPPPTLPPVPETVVVVEQVHRRVYVDQFGNPVDPNALPAGAAPTPDGAPPSGGGSASPPPRSGGAPATSAPPSGGGAPPPAAAPKPAPPPTAAAPKPPPPPPPKCTGSKCP